MTKPPKIRLGAQDDASACAKIIFDWLAATQWMPINETLGELENILYDGIPKREFYVIGDPIEGYLSLDVETNLIGGLYTARPGKGLGKALLDQVKHGRDFVQLWTHEPNKAARRFYLREGFVEVARDPDRSGDGVPEIRMEWSR